MSWAPGPIRASSSIRSFRDSASETPWSRRRVKKFGPRIGRTAPRTLALLDAADAVQDLRIPPGSRLEALHGDRVGQRSIRINDQWRVCFVWTDAGPEEVEVVDHH